jgi:hypothetical protein
MDGPAALAALGFEPVVPGSGVVAEALGAEILVAVGLATLDFAEAASGSSLTAPVLDFLVDLVDAAGSSSSALRFLDGAG